jgi:PAS domain S-box-containing protein
MAERAFGSADRRGDERLVLLADISVSLLSAARAQETVDDVLRRLSDSLALEIYFFYLARDDGKGLRLHSASGVPDTALGGLRDLRFGQAICGTVAATRQGVVAEDILASADARVEALREFGIQAYVCHPLVADDRLLGTLALGTRARTRVDAADVRLLETVSNLIALALGRTRLVDDLRDEVAARQHAERVLAEANSQLRAVFDEAIDAIVVFDDERRYVDVNPAACALFGLRREDLVGRRTDEFVAPGQDVEGAWRAFVQHGEQTGDFRIRHADGRTLDVEYRARAGVIGGLHLSAFRDVTARRRAEAEVAELLRREQAARAEAEAASIAKDEFLAMLGHELRNPLAAIRNAAYVLQRGVDDGAVVRHVAAITERQTQQLTQLLDDLLDAVGVARGKIALRTEIVDLRVLIEEAVATTRDAVARRAQSLVVTAAESLPVRADRTRLVQVFTNLLDKASKYTDPGGHIAVTATGEADHVRVSIRDTGIGIPVSFLPYVFEFFFRGESVRSRRTGGLGVGLGIVRRLVELHGGAVHASSDGVGRGSEFRVRLPRSTGEATPAAAPPDVEVGRHVLIVEDNRDAGESLRIALELEAHRVDVAETGAQAMRGGRRSR